MQRETRYVVFKTSDLDKLNPTGKRAMLDLIEAVEQIRSDMGKQPLRCVVVESDWPEYEKVWKMLAMRVDLTAFVNDPTTPPQLALKIQEFIKEHCGKC